jgi:signal transduction histidine kinase
MGYIHSSGSRKNQLKYFLIAFASAHVAAFLHFSAAYIQAEPFPHDFLLILFAALISYAIVRYRLMDITVVIHKGLAYGLLLGLIFVPAYMAIIISQRATPYSTPPLLAGTFIFACGLWILLKNPKAVTNRTFSLVCFGVCIWLFSISIAYSTTNEEAALFWIKLVYLGVVYIPAFFYQFCVSFLQGHEDKKILSANYLISTAFLLLLPTDYFINGLYSYFWGYYAKAGVLHPLFLGYFFLISGLSLRRLYQAYKAKEGLDSLEATRIRYVFWAFVIGYTASIDYIQNYGFELYPTGYVFVTLWAAIVTYAIAKYRVMDISLIVTKAKILRYAEVLTLIPLYFVILFLIRAFTGSTQHVLTGIIVAGFLLLSHLLVNVQKRMEITIGKALFRKRYDAYETLTGFSKAMVTILDLKDLTRKITETLSSVLGIEKVSLFLMSAEKEAYAPAASLGLDAVRFNDLQFKSSDPFCEYLTTAAQPIVREELERGLVDHPPEQPQTIVKILSLLESELCIPLVNKDRLIGFLNLGPKTDRGMYSQEDLDLLSTLAHHAAIALDNALLYEDLKRQKALMRRTDRLRSMETMAGGLAHEIRNPLTSIKTFMQLAPLRQSDPEFMESFTKIAEEEVERIERLIQEILDYARNTGPRFTQQNLNEVIESTLRFIILKAERQNTRIETELADDLPPVSLDRQQIKQVLLNLFINSMEAMPKGGFLTVRTRRLTMKDGLPWVRIEVQDTGQGIPQEELERIFDPFFTTKHESKEREGTGLGLTIVHQIISDHRGTIEVDSRPGVGTVFLISLPANPARYERRTARMQALS